MMSNQGYPWNFVKKPFVRYWKVGYANRLEKPKPTSRMPTGTGALPLQERRIEKGLAGKICKPFFYMAPFAGLEPATI